MMKDAPSRLSPRHELLGRSGPRGLPCPHHTDPDPTGSASTFPPTQPAPVLLSGPQLPHLQGLWQIQQDPTRPGPCLAPGHGGCTDPGNCPRPRQHCKGDTAQGHGDRVRWPQRPESQQRSFSILPLLSTKTHTASLLALTPIPSPPKSHCPLGFGHWTRDSPEETV